MAVHIEFVSSKILKQMPSPRKIEFVLESVRKNVILVLEEPLSLDEERLLIRETMKKISKNFPGIEISSLSPSEEDLRSAVIRLLGGKTSGLTVVGPANLVKEMKKDPDKLRVLTK
ncbi:MAG: DUF2073 domain-containing protein [Candidatus Micrarchaeota archaeon]